MGIHNACTQLYQLSKMSDQQQLAHTVTARHINRIANKIAAFYSVL